MAEGSAQANTLIDEDMIMDDGFCAGIFGWERRDDTRKVPVCISIDCAKHGVLLPTDIILKDDETKGSDAPGYNRGTILFATFKNDMLLCLSGARPSRVLNAGSP